MKDKKAATQTSAGHRRITITEKDIAKALTNDSTKCVVAQAIARTFPNAHHIEVDTQTIRFTDGTKRFAYLTPYAVQGYVVAFDAGDSIEPFTFQLHRPVPVRQPHRPAGKYKPAVTRAAAKAYNRARSRRKKEPTVDARAAYAAAKEVAQAKYPDAVHQPDSAAVRTPPRVFKTKQRTYGMRALRINREQAAEREAARELESE